MSHFLKFSRLHLCSKKITPHNIYSFTIMFNLIKNIFGSTPAVDYKKMLSEGAVIVDVRTTAEFKSGHIKGAINIPLDVIASKAQSLKDKNVPIITCCRSGNRSGAAASLLRNLGIEVVNGGAWDSLEAQI
jgi:phage shock protein E